MKIVHSSDMTSETKHIFIDKPTVAEISVSRRMDLIEMALQIFALIIFKCTVEMGTTEFLPLFNIMHSSDMFRHVGLSLSFIRTMIANKL